MRGNLHYQQTFFNHLYMPPYSFIPVLLPPPSREKDVFVFLYFLTEFFITFLTISVNHWVGLFFVCSQLSASCLTDRCLAPGIKGEESYDEDNVHDRYHSRLAEVNITPNNEV